MEIRPISSAEHQSFLIYRSELDPSFLQSPSWGGVKKGAWRSHSIGFFDGPGNSELVGAALILARKTPRLNKFFFYIPEGPTLPIDKYESALELLTAYAKQEGAFALRIGPMVVKARWEADLIKSALADESISSLNEITPSYVNPAAHSLENILTARGFTPSNDDPDGFGAGQPRFLYQLPIKDKSRDDLLAGFNQLWRRNIKKSENEGVRVRIGAREDLGEFHRVYIETAARDNFTPRPLSYFQQMWDAFNIDSKEPDLILFIAEWNSKVVAAAIYIELGFHTWYLYGASSTEGREARPSNALQWAMMERSLQKGAHTYDLRGITATLDKSNPHAGLLQFKVGVGGRAVEVMGEWDYSINPLLYLAFRAYLNRR
ncbi:MAG: peptidoglycan bridge formation glycyltransferase FemA/FemB family protein [Actinobacteria bacterium]|nr:peptidoglycan bridge formation glycyltransferase FemA/FemB family protein [Actinomycetota bacterium]